MIYMGYTKSRGKRHLVDIYTGYETKAFCGAKIEFFVTNYNSDDQVPYSIHWENGAYGGSYNGCQHCDRMVRHFAKYSLRM